MRRKLVCKRDFGGSVDITDPCYRKDVWCRMDGVAIKPGNYYCYKWTSNEKYIWNGETHDDYRVGVLGIYLDGMIPTQKSMESIGTIGVDAGMAGFFENKPDYSDSEWRELCNRTRQGDAWNFEEGVFSSSGYGDGEYPVYAYKVNGEIVALEIRFL